MGQNDKYIKIHTVSDLHLTLYITLVAFNSDLCCVESDMEMLQA